MRLAFGSLRAPIGALVSLMWLVAAWPGTALAQSSAFTYQGKLTSNAQPAEGLHDFRFKLFDAATGGTQIGTTQCVDNLLVGGGVFMATLDFGAQFVTSGQRFIEIEVRKDTGLTCANAVGYVVLTPRQAVTPTPSATHAKTAFALAAADGSPANAVIVDNAGKLGVGTQTPTHIVHIANIEPTIALQDTDASGGPGGQQVGYISYRDGTNTLRGWEGFGTAGDPDFSIVNARANGDIVLNPFDGNVGIGTASPSDKLEVHGDISLGDTGELLAIGGTLRLRVVVGTVSENGGSGFGYTATKSGTGFYDITFDPPFVGAPPAVAVTVMAGSFPPADYAKYTQSSNLNKITVNIKAANGTNTDSAFSLIAIGQR